MATIHQMLLGPGVAPVHATWNPSDKSANVTLSNSDLTATLTSIADGGVRSTISQSAGKKYFEYYPSISSTDSLIGLSISGAGFAYNSANTISYHGVLGYIWKGVVHIGTGATFAYPDVIGVDIDISTDTLSFYKNDVLQWSGTTGLTYPVFARLVGGNNINDGGTANFGASAFVGTKPAGSDSWWL